MDPKVLIVEDDVNLNRLFQKAFRSASFPVIAAYNMNAALQALQKDVIELVVLDPGLPDGNGWEVVEIIENTELPYPAPQIIVVTGRDPSEIQPEYLEHYHVLQKPVNIKTLMKLTLDLRLKRKR